MKQRNFLNREKETSWFESLKTTKETIHSVSGMMYVLDCSCIFSPLISFLITNHLLQTRISSK